MVRILVVEDEVLIARELQGRLQEMGYEAPARKQWRKPPCSRRISF